MTYKWVASSGNPNLFIPVDTSGTSHIPKPSWSRKDLTQKIPLVEKIPDYNFQIGVHQWEWYKRNHDPNIHQKTKKQKWVDIVKSKRFKTYASQTDIKTEYNTKKLGQFLSIPSAYTCN